jgi:hypothetical protein
MVNQDETSDRIETGLPIQPQPEDSAIVPYEPEPESSDDVKLPALSPKELELKEANKQKWFLLYRETAFQAFLAILGAGILLFRPDIYIYGLIFLLIVASSTLKSVQGIIPIVINYLSSILKSIGTTLEQKQTVAQGNDEG